ncbi:MAG: hypothetical protein HZC43_04800 [Nitrosomonadales bacterium]|nr:hypothetical protein [Nitrosomonadales bacterium]
MNQEQGKEINQVNAPVSDAAEVAATGGELAEQDLDAVAGGLAKTMPKRFILHTGDEDETDDLEIQRLSRL